MADSFLNLLIFVLFKKIFIYSILRDLPRTMISKESPISDHESELWTTNSTIPINVVRDNNPLFQRRSFTLSKQGNPKIEAWRLWSLGRFCDLTWRPLREIFETLLNPM